MNVQDHLQPEELAEYLLEQCPIPQQRRWAEHLSTCPECQRELELTRAALGLVAETAALAELPQGARQNFLRRMERLPSRPAAAPARMEPRTLLAWSGWVAAAAALILAVLLAGLMRRQAGELAQLREREGQDARTLAALRSVTGPAAIQASLTEPKAAPARPRARVQYAPGTRTLLLLASDLEPLPQGKAYELWLIPASGAAPMPAGTFSPDGKGSAAVVFTEQFAAEQPKAFGITVEQAAGSATPTLPIVLAGAPGD